MAPLLLFFVKEPRPGAVKTRLAKDIGNEAAAKLYAAFAKDMLATAKEAGLDVLVCHDPPEAAQAVREWLGHEDLVPQAPGDLGQRMQQGFELAFDQGHGEVLLMGSDLPDLPVEHVLRLAELLRQKGAVLGPSRDGGYYCVGFTRAGYRPEIFANMPWSTPEVFELTRERLAQHGVEPGLGPKWQDVDDAADLAALQQRLATGESKAPRTLKVLNELGLVNRSGASGKR
jgi:hypothetical protein